MDGLQAEARIGGALKGLENFLRPANV